MNPQPTPKTQKKGITLPIILMLWPITVLIVNIALYALINFITVSNQPSTTENCSASTEQMITPSEETNTSSKDDQCDLFNDASNDNSWVTTVLNITLFTTGAAAILAGPPSFIVGLILLIKRSKSK